MPRTSGQERRGGRILPHQRDTNDNAAILGGDLAPGGDYHENYNETVKHEMSDKARKEYRCRIVRISEYWKKHCPRSRFLFFYYCSVLISLFSFFRVHNGTRR